MERSRLSDQFSLRPEAYIYLRCPPEVNVDRIAKRSREGEYWYSY